MRIRYARRKFKEKPGPLLPLDLGSGYSVPASINRYLREYQRVGTKFLASRILVANEGAILGDDMGLGKTIQIVALLSALLGKEGKERDRRRRGEKRKAVEAALAWRRGKEMNGYLDGTLGEETKMPEVHERAPILIVVPASVIDNWGRELATWGHFGFGKYAGQNRDAVLDDAKSGKLEVVIIGKALFSAEKHFRALKKVPWKLIIVDEFHEYKGHKTTGYNNVKEVRGSEGRSDEMRSASL